MEAAPAARTLRRKLLFALIPVVALLLLAEVGLRVMGYQSRLEDPYESFVNRAPLFVEDGEDLVTSPARAGWFHVQRFSRRKPEGTVRFFVFGGSTVGGANISDSPENCFGAQLRDLLAMRRPDLRFEQVNVGGKAYASYRLVPLVEECLAYSPDFIIVMSGNNEFLEARHYAKFRRPPGFASRLWRSLRIVQFARDTGARILERKRPPADPDGLMGPATADDDYVVPDLEAFEATRAAFEEHLRTIVSTAGDRGVPVILCTVATNLNSPPRAMGSYGPLSKKELGDRFDDLADRYQDGELEEVIAEAGRVLADNDRAAPFHYLAAMSLEELGRHEEARQSYLRAKDTDAFPHRALSSFNESVRRIATETDARLFDAEARFHERARDGITARDLFVDHCHPTREAHGTLAEGLLEVLVEEGWAGH